MPKPRRQRRARRTRNRRRGGDEWVGGLFTHPAWLTDRDEPYHPAAVLWVDGDGLIVGQEIVEPEETEGALARVLLRAMAQPMIGPPRRPDRVRVADAALAAEAAAALGDATPIEVAPTPELDEVFQKLVEWLGGEEARSASYLGEGRIPPEAVDALFGSAEVLYRLAPWEVAGDDQVLRMDIPALGVEGACVTVLGNLGEVLGLAIFPSLAGYEAFTEASGEPPGGSDLPDFGSEWLALTFERREDLPEGLRREVAEHGWPLADADAVPWLGSYERDGAPRPLEERDLEIASACAAALASFWARHQHLFEAESFEPVCESYFNRRDLEVRFTLPYEAQALFDVAAQPAPAEERRVGRNDPCPCGSGRKYKKCHLAADRAEREARREAAGDHDLDALLTAELIAYADRRFEAAWRRVERDFAAVADSSQLATPWSLYQHRVQGKTVAAWYLEEHASRISKPERLWLAAQQAAWLSVWEVIAVEPGKSVTLRDLLSDEERCVREGSASQSLVVRDALLGRVVDHGGLSLLCGLHPRPLPPLDAAEVVRRARGRLRRKRAVPVERLRDEGFGRYLIKRWEEAVFDLDVRSATPPEVQNSDGDPILFTTDHFALAPGGRAEVARRLAGLEGVESDDADPGDAADYVFFAPGKATPASLGRLHIGRARLAGAALRLETNSRERADALRARVEDACGELLRHRAREHADPLSEAAEVGPPGPPPEVPPEAEELALAFKRRHYASWPDEALPALGGRSPRQAVRTAEGRNAVDALLKQMENLERRSAGAHAFDFSALRRELGLA